MIFKQTLKFFVKKVGIKKQEQTLFNDLRQGPCKWNNKKNLCIKEGVPLNFEILV